MCFAWPDNFVYLLLLIPLAVLFGYGFMRRKEAQSLFQGGPRADDTIRRMLLVRMVLHYTGIALLLISLAGPRLCHGTRMVLRQSADVVFMLDISNSMLAGDVVPTRLERAREGVRRISVLMPESRRALLLFAAKPLVQCPLTSDREAFEALLGMASPALIEEQGTSFGKSFGQAIALFSPTRAPVGSGRIDTERIVVMLSDGEDHEGGAEAAAKRLGRAGIQLFVLGVGSPGKSVIPDPQHPGQVKRDAAGSAVLTRFDPETLRRLAAAAGGVYIDIGGSEAPVEAVAQRIGSIVAASRPVAVPAGGGTPLSPCLLGVALFLLLVERIMDAGWRRGGG
ncbi:MAG: VWA domain-containing protein [Chlorobiaceae bacterium]|nr:VWA domain-containing protein [Chlorobiaceae bacterium]